LRGRRHECQELTPQMKGHLLRLVIRQWLFCSLYLGMVFLSKIMHEYRNPRTRSLAQSSITKQTKTSVQCRNSVAPQCTASASVSCYTIPCPGLSLVFGLSYHTGRVFCKRHPPLRVPFGGHSIVLLQLQHCPYLLSPQRPEGAFSWS
jgi:hypothetical protein